MKNCLFGSIIFLIGFTISCNGQNDPYQATVDNIIPHDLTHKLPKRIGTKDYIITLNLKPELNKFIAEPVFIYIEYKPNNNYFDSLKATLIQTNYGSYQFDDSCNVIIYNFQKDMAKSSFIGREWLYYKWVKKLEGCNNKRNPIPNFIEVGDGEFKYKKGISKEYTLYITEAKSGKHFDEKHYVDEVIMPESWEHGFSQGYAINEKEKKVIYWFVIW